MVADARRLTYVRVVHAAPPVVYHAFTNAVALEEWLCEDARCDVREGGRLCLRWTGDYDITGEYVTLVPDRAVAFTWTGLGEPGATRVDVTLEAVPDGTRVTLVHGGLGAGEAWAETEAEFRRGWERSLDNLASVLADGVDRRVYDRPMLGIVSGDEVTEALASAHGLSIAYGIRVSDVVPGMGAEAAGLRAGDIVVRIGDVDVPDWKAFASAMGRLGVGDRVSVVFHRGESRHEVLLELHGRPVPSVPTDAAALAAALREEYAARGALVADLLAGVPERDLDRPPAPGEWSAREAVAHIVTTERALQAWFATLVAGVHGGQWASDQSVWVRAVAATCPTADALMAELSRAGDQTVAMAAGLPEAFFARRGSVMRLADIAIFALPYHTRTHLEQARSAVAAARTPPS